MLGTLQTPRLILRPLAPDDWQVVHAYTGDPGVMTYVPEGVMSEEQTRTFVATSMTEEEQAYAVVLRAEGRLIGHMPFHPWYAPRIFEIGWVFHPRYHGQGFATEAATAVLGYGFETLGLHRIIATCQPENVASWRVMEKLGMVREAHFRKVFPIADATWLDEYLYAILEEDWFTRHA